MRKDMNISIDIDGVLCSEDFFQLAYGMKYCCQKELKIFKFSPFSKETKDIFGWSSKDDHEFWKINYLNYLTTSAFIYPFAAQFIQNLYKNGHNIFIISQRTQTTLDKLGIPADMEFLTREWLEKNHIPFHQLILTKKPKQFFIDKLNIDLMIDDDPQVLILSSKYTNVIGFRSHCNLEPSLPGIPMVSSWKELEDRFGLLFNKK